MTEGEIRAARKAAKAAGQPLTGDMKHLITGTGRKPGTYRTVCGKTIRREQGEYAYTAAERAERVTCPTCKTGRV